MSSPRENPPEPGDQKRGDEDVDAAALRRSHEALQELYLVTAEPGLEPVERIERMLEIGRERLGVESAHLSRIDPETDSYDVELAAGDGPIEVGQSFAFSTVYCRETVEHDEPQLFPDLEDSVWAGTPAQETHGLSCYVGGRVEADGALYGTVCFSGTEAREPFTEDERTLVNLLVEWIGDHLEQRHLTDRVAAQRAAIEAADSAIAIADHAEDGARPLTYVNRGFEELTGYDREAVLGRDWQFLQGPETDPATTAAMGAALRAGEHVETVVRNYRADGTAFWNEVEITPIREDGEVVRYVGTLRDVTERVEQRRAVEALLERTRSLLAAESTEAVAGAAATAVEDILGYDCVLRLWDADTELLHPVAGEAAAHDAVAPISPGRSLSGQAFERGISLESGGDLAEPGGYGTSEDSGEGLAVPLGGHGTITVSPPTAPVGDFDRRVMEILAETVEAALDRAEQRDRLRLYETAIEQGSEMTAVLGADRRVELVSDSLAAFLDTDREALVGTRGDDLLPAEDVTAMAETVDGVDPGESRRFESTLTVDGESRPVELDISLGEGPDPVIVAVVRDIAELTEARGALSDQRDRFDSLFDRIPDPVAEYGFEDGEPVIRRCNEAFADVFSSGRSPTELRGRWNHEVVRLVEPGDQRGRDDARASIIDGDPVTRELRRLTTDGPRAFLFRGVPFTAGDERRAFGIYTDITDRKQRSRRVEVLNRVLRHNVRNQMNIAKGNASLLADAVESERATEAADGLLAAIHDVLSVSEKAREAERALAQDYPDGDPPATVAKNVVERSREVWPAATIALDAPADPVQVSGSGRLQPVLSNLVENALEHNEPGVTVRVDMEAQDGALRLRVADDGAGVPELEQALINGEREITQLHHGNGIGLWVVRWVVDAMGGSVRFEAEDGWNAVVVTVPQADEESGRR